MHLRILPLLPRTPSARGTQKKHPTAKVMELA